MTVQNRLNIRNKVRLKSQQCFDCQFTAWVPSRLDTFNAVRVGVVWLHLAHRETLGQKRTIMNTESQKCHCTFYFSCSCFFYPSFLPLNLFRTNSLHCTLKLQTQVNFEHIQSLFFFFSGLTGWRRSHYESFVFDVNKHNWSKHRCNH